MEQEMGKMAEKAMSAKVSGRQSPDCMASTSITIETAQGAEQVNINLGTGEITYGPDACTMEEKSAEGKLRQDSENKGLAEKE